MNGDIGDKQFNTFLENTKFNKKSFMYSSVNKLENLEKFGNSTE